jgi:hypothetical protein
VSASREDLIRTDKYIFDFLELINVSDDASSYEGPFERPYSSGPTLSALLSSDILFELLPFSNSQHRTTNTTLPAPVPATNFTSTAFLYCLPNFPDHQTWPQYFNHSTEYLQRLESQVPLSDPECDLSSFDRWTGNEAFEMKMTDEMLDELARRTSRGVQSEDGVAYEEMLIRLSRLSELCEHRSKFKRLDTRGLSKLQGTHDRCSTYYPCFNR